MKTELLNSDNYSTSASVSRSIYDKMFFGTSFYFWSKFLGIVLRNRKLSIAGKFDTESWASASYDIFKLIENCGGKFHLEGLDNISKSDGPVVFVSNHMSMLESMIFTYIIASKREVTFVVKKSLTTHKIFGPIMRARKPVSVDRTDPIADFKTVMTEGAEILENDTSIVIFPQSQRMVQFDQTKFNKLGIKLAKKSKVQIVPVAIKTDFWKNGKMLKDLGGIDRKKTIHMKFGAPLTIEGAGNNEHKSIIEFITNNLNQWN